jgi:fumarate hydratase subunit alpha
VSFVREIQCSTIKETIKELFLKANYDIGQDILAKLVQAVDKEKSPQGKAVLDQIVNNNKIAADERIAICQDTGMSIIFVQLGQEVKIAGGDFNEAIDQAVREAYTEGYLRKSVVADPLFDRKNTRDNTPAIVYVDIMPGDKMHIKVTAKGFGSENMSQLKVLTPAAGVKGVKDFVVETVRKAGPNPCPPVIVGVGIGGTIDKAAQLAKRATIRSIEIRNPDPRYAALEQELLELINKLGVGPGGLGGTTTALGVNIEHFPTHIASLPVVVNICCHAARHAHAVI